MATLLWVGLMLWFFNSPYFGFSQATVCPNGIRLNYGLFSFRNTTLPIETPWEIESRFKGIRKLKKIYFIRIGSRESMRVTEGESKILKELGRSIDQMREKYSRPQNPKASNQKSMN